MPTRSTHSLGRSHLNLRDRPFSNRRQSAQFAVHAMSPPLPPLPPNVRHLLTDYIGQFRLKELPAPFTQRNTSLLHKTTQGVPIVYKHRDTGETLQVHSHPWKSAHKLQSVVIASGKSLPEPVIIVPEQRGSTELRIWKGEYSDHHETQCPIYKVFDRGKLSRSVSGSLPHSLFISGSTLVLNMPSSTVGEGDVTRCRCEKRSVAEGEMVICEECDTWQHIPCYYPNDLLPAVHFCEDCGSKYHDTKRAAKRQKIDVNAAPPSQDRSDATDKSVAKTVFTRRDGAFSPHLGSSAIPYRVAVIGEREPSSEDEPLASKSSKKNRQHEFGASKEKKIESVTTPVARVHQQTVTAGTAASPPTTHVDLTDDTEDGSRKVKIQPEDDSYSENASSVRSTENASTLLAALVTPAASSAPSASIIATPSHLMTPDMTPTVTPQPLSSTRSCLVAGDTPQLVNNATTFVFLDSQNFEIRRRTFEELGGRLKVGTLFAHAVRAGLISKSDSDAILSVTICRTRESFAILKDDKPDFAALLNRIEAAGLCMVEVRLD